MKFAGCDLHKETITICVVNQSREVLCRQRLVCRDEPGLRSFFDGLGEFQAVVEAIPQASHKHRRPTDAAMAPKMENRAMKLEDRETPTGMSVPLIS